MKLKDLISVYTDGDITDTQKIEIVNRYDGDYERYSSHFASDGGMLEMLGDKEIVTLSATGNDQIRVELKWDDRKDCID